MDWQIISTKFPLSFNAFKEWHNRGKSKRDIINEGYGEHLITKAHSITGNKHVVIFPYRNLFDFFDSKGIIVLIDEMNFENFSYTICSGAVQSLNGSMWEVYEESWESFPNRKSAEIKAFTEAFKELENQLIE